jgi:hypothetical protein
MDGSRNVRTATIEGPRFPLSARSILWLAVAAIVQVSAALPIHAQQEATQATVEVEVQAEVEVEAEAEAMEDNTRLFSLLQTKPAD